MAFATGATVLGVACNANNMFYALLDAHESMKFSRKDCETLHVLCMHVCRELSMFPQGSLDFPVARALRDTLESSLKFCKKYSKFSGPRRFLFAGSYQTNVQRCIGQLHLQHDLVFKRLILTNQCNVRSSYDGASDQQDDVVEARDFDM